MSEAQAPSIYPVLRYPDPAAGIAFLEEAFGFRVHEVHKGPDRGIAHAEVAFGNSMVMVGPSGGGEAAFDTGAQSIYVVADDVDALHDRAVAAGAKIVYPLTDQDYGSRDFSAKDPHGNVWSFGTYRPTPPVMTIAGAQSQPAERRGAVVLDPDAGRRYDMGPIRAVFKADGAETAGRYSISEWWLEAHTTGPGPHSHPEDDVFYVLGGTMSLLVDGRWIDAPAGSFVLVPGGATHDFENRSDARAGVLNVSVPGDFEQHMPAIVDWFAEHPPGAAGA